MGEDVSAVFSVYVYVFTEVVFCAQMIGLCLGGDHGCMLKKII